MRIGKLVVSGFLTGLKNFDAAVSGLSMTALVGLTVAGVFMRYVTRQPIIWLEEVQLILFVWVAFFGSSVAFRLGSHIVIEAVVDMFPRRTRCLVETVNSVLVVLMLALLVYLECVRGLTLVRTGRTTNILGIPLYFNYFGVAASCLFMMVNFIVQRIGVLREWRSEDAEAAAAGRNAQC